MKRIAYISCFGVIAALTVEFGVIGVLPQIADYYKITIDKAGQLMGVYELVAAISGPFMALLVSNFNRKWVVISCLGISVCASVVSSFAPPFSALLIARAVVALTDSVFHSVTLASVIRNVNEEEDAKMMSIVLSGFSIAAISIIPLAAYVGNTFTWQDAFLVKAMVSLIALTGVLFVFPSMPVSVRKTYRGQLSILTKPLFLWTAMLCFLMLASAFSLYSYFADFLGEEKGMSGTTISYMLLIFGTMGVIGNWLAGKLVVRSIFLTCLCTLLSVIVVAIGFYFSGENTLLNIFVIAIWGLLFTFGPLVITLFVNKAAPDAMEFGFALTASFIGLGIAMGSYFGGWVITSKGVEWAPFSGIGFCLAAVITLLIITRLHRKIELA
ncbi:MAG TPA: MFS transporter [Cyclobacteriaceae bacterium]